MKRGKSYQFLQYWLCDCVTQLWKYLGYIFGPVYKWLRGSSHTQTHNHKRLSIYNSNITHNFITTLCAPEESISDETGR